jgi:molybdopterin/thiamine biosynthesis adenylyltransferase
VGTIGIVDRDVVALSNLHRQILHTAAEVGQPKSHSAKARLAGLNPDITIHAIQDGVTASTAGSLVAPYRLVLDGSDNFPTRYLVNDACVLAGVPLIHGGVVRTQGQVFTVQPGVSACFRCVFPEPPPPLEFLKHRAESLPVTYTSLNQPPDVHRRAFPKRPHGSHCAE